ncbi:hypothetical protein H0I76_16760 [Limibaculum sp. M0105]|uniref:RHS repeat-associated core domain-containing protein n=2 Tax=Thermohalobaculum xanthum TaxID=2753746 RepID=A0A8J7MB35_9RHOB|nr:hypothetical protein [Thermohalobaculum xanthum]
MRDYDRTTGRYLQPDPIGLIDGASAYGYARQSPLRKFDPEGRACRSVYNRKVGAVVIECDPGSTYDPSGLSSALSGAVNNTEFQSCFSACVKEADLPGDLGDICTSRLSEPD